MFRRSRVISSSAPNGSSMSRSAGSKESARAIETRCCIPPESCHGWCPSKPVSSTSSIISRTRSARSAAVPADHLQRERDVLRDRAPVVEDGVLEDDAVVAVEARLTGGLAVHHHVPGRGLDEVADDAQQRRLAASRRPDERDELARPDIEVDPLQGDDPAACELLADAAQGDDGALLAHATCSGARRTNRCSPRTMTRKKKMPSAAATRLVAQRSFGELA